MRIVMMIAAMLGLAGPVAAQDAHVFEQYKAIGGTFGMGESPGSFFTERPEILLDGLMGDWFPIGALMPESNDVDLFAKACEMSGIRLTVRRLAFDMNRFHNIKERTFTTSYASRGGNSFASYTEPSVLIKALGLDEVASDPAAIARILNPYNGIAAVWRPSKDILIVQTNYNAPEVFARCQ